ncbi:MAG: O-antigen ligase family protein [Bacteroidia bacterium]
MKFKISAVVVALAIYLPFETLILKYMPVPDAVYSFMRLGIEMIIYLLFFMMIFNNMSRGKLLSKTLLDIPFLVFLGFAIFTMLANKAPIGDSLVDLRGLFKYALLYFIIANIDFENSLLRKFLTAFVIVAFIQGIITASQHFIGISQFWYPRSSDVEIVGKSAGNFKLLQTGFGSGREQGSGIGTFGDTVPLGNFMVISIALIASLLVGYIRLNAYRTIFLLITLGLVLFALFCTYSRGSVLVGFLGIPLVFLFSRKLHKLYPFVLIASLFLCVFVTYTAIAPKPAQTYYNPKLVYTDPVSNFLEAFSSSYAENTLDKSRGYVITTLVPGYIKTIPLIGYGPSMENSLTITCNKVLGVGNFHAENVMVIADVYWFALLSCYGIIGLAIFCVMLGCLFYGAFIVFRKSEYPEYKIIGLIMITILIVNVPYMFIIRTLLFRPFAFYFWLFAGLVGGEYRRIKAKEKSVSVKEDLNKRYQNKPALSN